MEPVQHKRLSTALILAGLAVAAVGIILLFTPNSVAGIVLLLIGIIMVLGGLPAMILLAAYSAKEEWNNQK